MNEVFLPTSLPTYVVNLPERTDRRLHIEREFSAAPNSTSIGSTPAGRPAELTVCGKAS